MELALPKEKTKPLKRRQLKVLLMESNYPEVALDKFITSGQVDILPEGISSGNGSLSESGGYDGQFLLSMTLFRHFLIGFTIRT